MKFIENILVKYVELSRSQKFYAASIYLIPFWALSLLFPFETMTKSLFLGYVCLGVLGVISDILIIYKKIWSSLLGKGVIIVTYAMLTNFALSLSSQAVNSIVEVEPSKLLYSISFVSLLTIPFLISLCSAVLFGVLILFGQFYFFFLVLAKDLKKIPALAPMFPEKLEPYEIPTMIVRFIYIGVLLNFVFNFFQIFSPSYDKFVINQASRFIYNFEAYSNSRCKLKNNEKSILINDKEIVIAKKLPDGSYSFNLQACEPRLSPDE